MFHDKVVMITGGTGSFGIAFLQKLLAFKPAEIRIFSRDEKKQDDMRCRMRPAHTRFILGDVRDYRAVQQACRGVDYIFHAAALKQVPSCEFCPDEALRTNVIGTENVINAAIAERISRLVLLSTDKAVYPVNSMGMTKALAEKILIASAVANTEIILTATRYGNVIGSRGSVIPLFLRQIRQNLPLTVTVPHMTRFFMTLEESVDLVFHAFAHAVSGDIFVQKAPACSIGDLAKALKQIYASPVPIKIIGMRQGEKLHETLVAREEMARAIEVGKYYRIPQVLQVPQQGFPELPEMLAYDSEHTTRLTVNELVIKLQGTLITEL